MSQVNVVENEKHRWSTERLVFAEGVSKNSQNLNYLEHIKHPHFLRIMMKKSQRNSQK